MEDELEKEFWYQGLLLTRYDYESMPCPMHATGIDDDTMQKIAKDTCERLIGMGWTQEQVSKYLGEHVDDILDGDSEGDQIKSDFWRYMEKAAIDNGMQYYEDMTDGMADCSAS